MTSVQAQVRAPRKRTCALGRLLVFGGLLAIGVALPLLPGRAGAGSSGPSTTAAPITVEGITSYRLSNGLQVLLIPDAGQPKVTVAVTYFVGSRHEGYGETGMAHLLEHMLFKGTPRHKDPDSEIEQRGGDWNAETESDWTYYYQTHLADLPGLANLHFALDLEAERMTHARIVQEDLDKEFSVVRNELEIGENSPSEILHQRTLRAAFTWHGYGRDTIGSRSDIEHAPISRLREFYRRYYRPDNAQLTVAGRFTPALAMPWIAETFGRIARPPTPVPLTYTVEPQQDGERQVMLRRTGEEKLIGVAYHALPAVHPDYAALEAALDALTREGTGRLYRELISPGLLTSVHAETPPSVEPGVVWLLAEAGREQNLEAVRDKLLAVVEGLGQSAVTVEELRRFQARKRKEFAHLASDGAQVASALRPWSAAGDFRLWLLYRDRIAQLTPAQVTAVARRLLVPANRTVGLFVPTAQPQRAPLPAATDVAAQVKGYKGQPPPAAGEAFAPTVEQIEQRTRRLTIAGGMRLLLLPKKTRGETVELALNLRFGSLSALRGKSAAVELLAPMLLRGTKQRSFIQLSDALDELQVEVSAVSGRSSLLPQTVSLRLRTLRRHLPALLALLAEMLREPSFDPGEFTRVQKEMVAGFTASLQDPMVVAKMTLGGALTSWPTDDPRYLVPLAEQVRRLQACRVSDVAELHRTLLGAEAAVLVLVGDFDADAVAAQVGQLFAPWHAARPYQRLAQPVQTVTAASVVLPLTDKQMAVAGLALPLQENDRAAAYPALRLLDHLLGEGNTARLYHRVREVEGLSYDVQASVAVPIQHDEDGAGAGAVIALATCAPPSARKALEVMLGELDAVAQHGVSEKELQTAKQGYARAAESERGDDGQLAEHLLWLRAEDRTLRFDEAVDRQVAALTPAAVQQTARKILVPARAVRVLAGDLPTAASPKSGDGSLAPTQRAPKVEGAPTSR